jgi:phenylalanyl-tRNA synthetase beta chain
MGGADSEVGDETTNIIIESAIFDPVSVRRTAFRYALRSEASQRFEKGQEHRMARLGADRTAALITRWGGGRIATGVVDTQPVAPPQLRVAFRPARVGQLLGAAIEVEEQRDLLRRVEIETEPAGAGDVIRVIAGAEPLDVAADPEETLIARIPGHRRDISIEADIIEEIARVRGYETLEGRLPDTGMPDYRPDPQRSSDQLRAALSGAGLSELLTHGLIGPEDHARLGYAAHDPGTIIASNPVTLDHSQLRRSMIPEHLRVLVDNERQRTPDLHAFELGAIHEWHGGRPTQREVLGLILAGRDRPVGLDLEPGPVDVGLAKGFLERLAARFTRSRLTYERLTPRAGVEHPGRTAAIVAVTGKGDNTIVGRVGELHPTLLEAYGVNAEHVIFAEVYVDAFERLIPQRRRIGRLEHLPGVERDIAVVVSEDTAAGQVEAVVREHGGPNLRAVTLFDQYRGAPLAENEKSLAYRLRYEFLDGDPDVDAVDPAVERLVAVLSARLGARLRS